MPHASFKIKPGIDVNETPALNEAGLSSSNLIRFIYDRNGLGLVQKIGGWVKYYSSSFTSKIRALWAWSDINGSNHLAVGTQNASGTFKSNLTIITNGSGLNATPQYTISNATLSIQATAGSPTITITDVNVSGINQFCSVYISTQISVGGIILFGVYPCITVGGNSYSIISVDTFGNPLNAVTSSTTSPPTLPTITTTTTDANVVTINLPSHGYIAGNNFPILIKTSVGGIELYGEYTILKIIDANNFTISSSKAATTAQSKVLNNGKANYGYSIGVGASQIGSGYGVYGFGKGGYGSGITTTPTIGDPISAYDWVFDNWGSYLIALPNSPEILLTPTSASSNGSSITVNYSETFKVPLGTALSLSGFSPSSFNIYGYVTASTNTSLTFSSTISATTATVLGDINLYFAPHQPIYFYDPLSNSPISVLIPNCPQYSDGIFVAMPQRQIVAWGTTFDGIPDPLLIRWSDVNDFTSWVGTVVNQAGSYRIPKGSKIVGCLQAPQQGLIWTDIGLWSMQYIGPPYVYGFNQIGSGCGLIAKKAAASLAGQVYWMGKSQFYMLSGSGVQPVPCPIWDVIFQNLDTSYLYKIRAAVNSLFGEITWYYPTLNSSGENNAYVKYNAYLQCWDFGTLSRSAWVDQSVLGNPIGADPNTGYIYQHETSLNADGNPILSSFQTGYFAMTEANFKIFVDEIWPDMKWGTYAGSQNALVYISFIVADFAGQVPTVYGPYQMTKDTTWFNPRFRGRLVSIKIESSDGINTEMAKDTFWRLGNIRYRLQQDGKY